jgi:hypothetical protein
LVDLDNPPSLLDQGRAKAPVPVQRAPHHVPFEDADSADDDDNESYTLRDDDSGDEGRDDDDADVITMD